MATRKLASLCTAATLAVAIAIIPAAPAQAGVHYCHSDSGYSWFMKICFGVTGTTWYQAWVDCWSEVTGASPRFFGAKRQGTAGNGQHSIASCPDNSWQKLNEGYFLED